jgi:hypothetical protein
VTTGVGDTVAVATAVGVLVTVTVGTTVTVGITVVVGITVAVGRTVTFGVRVTAGVSGTEALPVGVGWTEPPAVATNVVAAASGGADDVQPDTAAVTRTAMAPMPTAAGSARGVRTLFRYPPGEP